MTKKNNAVRASAITRLTKDVASLKMAKKNKSKPKNTPFADAGGVVGKAVSKWTGIPQLSGVGRWLGTGIGSIFGSGDYQMTGPLPSYNILSGQIPKFDSTAATNIVCHREYLGDITGASAFVNNQYPINPGLAQTFPWLSTIAASYQQYRIHGLVFEFRPLITDYVTSGAPGVIVMATNYNSSQTAYTSRQQAENSEFAVSVKPTTPLVHMIECKTDQVANKLYNVRTGSIPSNQDLRLYDYGLTQIITQNNPAQNLGELWVTYCVEFFKPTLSTTSAISTYSGAHIERNTVSAANPFGTVGLFIKGGLTSSITVTPTTITITGLQVGVQNILEFCWNGSSVSSNPPVITYSGATTLSYFKNGTAATSFSSTAAQASVMVVQPLITTSTTLVITADGSGVFPTSSYFDFFMTPLDPLVNL